MKVLIGPPHLTRFERSRIIGARALQLSMGAPLLIENPGGVTDPILIAEQELIFGALPITIRRYLPEGEKVLPDGSRHQDIPLKQLIA